MYARVQRFAKAPEGLSFSRKSSAFATFSKNFPNFSDRPRRTVNVEDRRRRPKRKIKNVDERRCRGTRRRMRGLGRKRGQTTANIYRRSVSHRDAPRIHAAAESASLSARATSQDLQSDRIRDSSYHLLRSSFPKQRRTSGLVVVKRSRSRIIYIYIYTCVKFPPFYSRCIAEARHKIL